MFGYLFVCSLFSVCFVTTASEHGGETMKRWAVLVAGSNGSDNYRHQADVAEAYHLLIKHGIPAERIITFAYDDIANNRNNSFPGEIFKDYYTDLVIDYRGEDVTRTMFTHVLMGDSKLKEKGLKVVESGPKDHVFIYFPDHGASDLIAFTDGELDANEPSDTINYLYQHKRYAKLVIYIEACGSGCMFNRALSSRINFFATTAENPHDSSDGTFGEDNEIEDYLADEYSYNWIKDSQTPDVIKLTLKQLFMDVRSKTVSNHVQEYGKEVADQDDQIVSPPINQNTEIRDSVPSHQAHIHAMMRAVLQAKSSKAKSFAHRRLVYAIKLGELAEDTVNLIVEAVQLKSPKRMSQPVSIEDSLECYKKASNAFMRRCFSIQRVPEVGEHIGKLEHLCTDGVDASDILAEIGAYCH